MEDICWRYFIALFLKMKFIAQQFKNGLSNCGDFCNKCVATESQQAIINDVNNVKFGVYPHKTKTNIVKNGKEHSGVEYELE